MAGTNRNFPAAQFRQAIRDAAVMATSNDSSMVPTFRWDPQRTVARGGVTGRPYSFDGTVTPTETDVTDLTLDTVVAVLEKGAEAPEGTREGTFRGSKLTLTIMDVDYTAIVTHGGGRFAEAVMIGETEYRVKEIPKPDALFDVDVWTVHAFASSVVNAS